MWLAVEAAEQLDLKDLKVVLVSPYTSLVALAFVFPYYRCFPPLALRVGVSQIS